MTVHWLQPAAFVGLALLAIPIVLHLLMRQQSRRLPFPSLRFLRTTSATAWRRRVITDWPLLVVRLLILASAIAALAGPVLVTDARRAAIDERIARAIVVAASAGDAAVPVDAVVERERASSTFAATFASGPEIGAAVRDAVAWLEGQPPARREVVVVGPVRRGGVTAGDLASVPPGFGVRFEALPPSASPSGAMIAIADNGDGTRASSMRVTPSARGTDVTYEPSSAASDWLDVIAPAADRRFAEAARAAVLAEGLVNDRPAERRVTVAFAGGGLAPGMLEPSPKDSWIRAVLDSLPGLTGGQREERLVVVAGIPVTDPAAVDLVARVARAALTTSRVDREPFAIDPARLAAWTRAPGPASVDAAPADEDDRRWFWAAALILMLIEQFLRRRGDTPASIEVATGPQEARVA